MRSKVKTTAPKQYVKIMSGSDCATDLLIDTVSVPIPAASSQEAKWKSRVSDQWVFRDRS